MFSKSIPKDQTQPDQSASDLLPSTTSSKRKPLSEFPCTSQSWRTKLSHSSLIIGMENHRRPWQPCFTWAISRNSFRSCLSVRPSFGVSQAAPQTSTQLFQSTQGQCSAGAMLAAAKRSTENQRCGMGRGRCLDAQELDPFRNLCLN